jgi:hypothetical protein
MPPHPAEHRKPGQPVDGILAQPSERGLVAANIAIHVYAQVQVGDVKDRRYGMEHLSNQC